MDHKSDQEQQAGERKKDTAALYARLGLDAKTYREFERTRVPSPSQPSTPAEELGPRAVAGLETMRAPVRLNEPAPGKDPRLNALHNLNLSLGLTSRSPRHGAIRLAFFSLAGGTGKTTLAVNVARALSARNRDVVLVNTGNAFALDPYLHPRTPRFNVVSFLHAPGNANSAPVTVLQAPAADLVSGAQGSHAHMFLQQATHGAEFVLFDMSAALDGPNRDVLATVDHIVVPLVPDLQSAASVGLFDSLLGPRKRQHSQITFLFNRFDESRSFPREIRVRMEKLLGARLLPFAIREDRSIQDAAAAGLTLVDHDSELPANADFATLTEWVSSLNCNAMGSAPEIASGVSA